jgi:hypothetical protein
MQDLTKLAATEAARLISAGRLRPVELMEACLARIAEREPAVRAFAWFDVDAARLALGVSITLGLTFALLRVPIAKVFTNDQGVVEELGLAQAIWVLEVERFGPFLVDSDLAGNSLFERENAKIAPGIEKLYEGTKPATMRRYGETDDKTEEVI